MAPSSVTCRVCLDINPICQTIRWQVNVAGGNSIEFSLPFTFREMELSSRICGFCSLIKKGVEATCRDGEPLHCESNNKRIERGGRIIVQKSAPLEIELIHDKNCGKEEVLSRLQFFVANKDDEDDKIWLWPTLSGSLGSGHFGVLGIARNVPTLISHKTHITLINSWIGNCLQNHSSCDVASTSQLPSRLLDISGNTNFIHLVETKHLPTSGKPPSYATLSHCWGSKRFIQTTSSSIAFFYRGIRRDTLPATFRDAISVARALGLRFIWIDSLCIVQDSPEDWKHESTLMASIYSNCYVNIAATGAADSLRGCLTPRKPLHRSIPIFAKNFLGPEQEDKTVYVRRSLNGLHKLYSTPTILRNKSPGSWEEEKQEAPLLLRAWTFQERFLAPRTLHFCSSELVMECRKELRCECTGLDSIGSNYFRDVQDISYDSWLRAVEEYSRLRLSYETDRLIALMGIAKVFHARLMSTYLQGIWAEDLARGLLWDITRYEYYRTLESPLSVPQRRQSIEVASTWSWASMVMAEGMGIIFPAAHDGSFSKNEKFGLSRTASSSGTLLETNEICVNSEAFFATAFVTGMESERDEEENDTLLVLEEDIEDMVLISTFCLNLDIPSDLPGHRQGQTWEVYCLILGSMVETNYDLNERTEFLCTLVVKPGSVIDAWERIGVLDIRKDDVGYRSIGEREFNLI
ncbi:hypothetical protein OCU04_011765 [Sclerotinia nivalis]|uniref:Heterokaryon incompatibility domain-containing protein n=1 Tax=Sclerotinia nivalis TaxID=352851 RepID=A0A9X0A9P4_9HELO|nr:hypothetical protein OCU04_011765 [Sclerotinia nivalis]